MRMFKCLCVAVMGLALGASAVLAQPMGGRGEGHGGPGMLPGVNLQDLDLTTEQESLIKSVISSYEAKTKAAFEAVRTAHEALDDLVAVGSSDEDAIRTASVTLGDKTADLSIISAEMMKTIRGYLTEDQLTQLDEGRAARKKHFGSR